MRKKRSPSSSKYKGVHLDERGKWKARITFEGRLRTLGRFKTEEDAALRYNREAINLHKEFACLNQIPS